ncbi:SEC-C metal-binding domain-containing protein [Kribbella alba]|uniref:SEC-C metal-binding domain-containing protein n=1 Tax=Kribbella alba TaxID=190197 RepID=UPI003CD0B14D
MLAVLRRSRLPSVGIVGHPTALSRRPLQRGSLPPVAAAAEPARWCGSGTKYKECCGAPTH